MAPNEARTSTSHGTPVLQPPSSSPREGGEGKGRVEGGANPNPKLVTSFLVGGGGGRGGKG